MATFGQGINPQLGSIDYSAFSRGAAQQAQGIAQGGAGVAQGIRNLGQEFGQGIQQYKQNKLMAGQATSEFEAAAQQSPKLLSSISAPSAPPEVAKAFKKLQKDGQVGLKDAAVLSTYAKTFIMGEQRQERANMEMEKLKIDQANAVSERIRAQAAERASMPQQEAGTVMTAEQLKQMPPDMDFTAIPRQDGTFLVNKTSRFAPPANTPPAYESSYNKTIGEETAKRQAAQYDAANAAAGNINKLDKTLNILNKGDAVTGMGADVIKNVNRFVTMFTKDAQAGKVVSDTEVLDALLGSDVFPMIKSLGIGARGLDTPAEREFLRSVMTGTIPMNKQSLIRMTQIRRDIEERAINQYNQEYDSGNFKNFFEASRLKPKRFEIPSGDNSAPVESPSGGPVKILSVKRIQ